MRAKWFHCLSGPRDLSHADLSHDCSPPRVVCVHASIHNAHVRIHVARKLHNQQDHRLKALERGLKLFSLILLESMYWVMQNWGLTPIGRRY